MRGGGRIVFMIYVVLLLFLIFPLRLPTASIDRGACGVVGWRHLPLHRLRGRAVDELVIVLNC